VSVTYFSLFTTIVSTVAILVMPSISMELPSTPLEWTLLLGLGVCGFLLQFLLTAGLSYVPPPRLRKKSSASGQQSQDGNDDSNETKEPPSSSSGSRATSMIYMQMLFALFYDRVVWGSTLSPLSWLGSGLILGSAIYVAVVREGRSEAPATAERRDENETS
jgi:drug/metabolite transporter (DMT)-like permease